MNELLEMFNADNETSFNYEWLFELDGPVIIDNYGYDEILLQSGIYRKYKKTLLPEFVLFNDDEVISITKIKEFMFFKKARV
jgi:hypothetical protein